MTPCRDNSEMSARSKKSRLVRTRRLSDSDSSDGASTVTDASSVRVESPAPQPATPSWPAPSTCRMSGPGEPAGLSSSVSPVVTSWRRAAVRAVEIQAEIVSSVCQCLPAPCPHCQLLCHGKQSGRAGSGSRSVANQLVCRNISLC